MLRDCAMAIDALNFNGGANFLVQLAVAMGVLHEMAIDTMHAAFEVNVHQVNGDAVALHRVTRLLTQLGSPLRL